MGRVLMWPVWWLATICVVISGAIMGYLPVGVDWFDAVDIDDHLVSAGGYTTAAIVLLFGCAALEGFEGPKNARRLSLLFAGLYSFLALRAAISLDGLDTDGMTFAAGADSMWNGATGVLLGPWTWLLLTTGVWGWVRVVRHNRASGVVADLPARQSDPGFGGPGPSAGSLGTPPAA